MIKIIKKNRYNNLTFNDYIVDDSNKEVFNYFKSYCKNIEQKINDCENVVLSGSVGTGKTMIAKITQNILSKIDIEEEIQTGDYDFNSNSYLKRENKRKMNVEYITCPNLLKALREHFLKEKKENYNYHNCDILIVDEIGVQYNTDNERLALNGLFNYRYENYKPTILISNHKIKRSTEEEKKGINELLGLRIFDRVMSGSSKYFYINGKSKR